MNQQSCRLAFVGGPFDGFRQEIYSSVEELPDAVAIPINAVSARLLGVDDGLPDTRREAMYELIQGDDELQYSFRGERLSGKWLQPTA